MERIKREVKQRSSVAWPEPSRRFTSRLRGLAVSACSSRTLYFSPLLPEYKALYAVRCVYIYTKYIGLSSHLGWYSVVPARSRLLIRLLPAS